MVLCRTTTDIPDQSDIQLLSQCRTTQLLSIWKQCPWVTWNTPVGSNQIKTADHVWQICQGFCWINMLWGLGYGQFWFTGSNTESLILLLSDSDSWMWKSDLGWGASCCQEITIFLQSASEFLITPTLLTQGMSQVTHTGYKTQRKTTTTKLSLSVEEKSNWEWLTCYTAASGTISAAHNFWSKKNCFYRFGDFPHDTRFNLEHWLDIPLTSPKCVSYENTLRNELAG